MLRTSPRRLAPLLALLAVAATACSTVGETSAATVNGHEISADSVREELDNIRGNQQYRQAIEQQYGTKLAGTGKGTFASAFTAQVLSLKIYYQLFDESLRAHHALPPEREIKARRAEIAEQLKSLGGKRFDDAYIEQLARQDALVLRIQEEAATQACVSHILVGTDDRTAAEAKRKAEDLKRQLDRGANFAELAKSDSDDPGRANRAAISTVARGAASCRRSTTPSSPNRLGRWARRSRPSSATT
jgi:parvulin-like peptidyl-prolyl isomerase